MLSEVLYELFFLERVRDEMSRACLSGLHNPRPGVFASFNAFLKKLQAVKS